MTAPHHMESVPYALAMNWLLGKLGLNKVKVNAATIQKKFGLFGEPMAVRTAGKELIIRTLDIGGDKQLDYMDLPKESNPFLGYRAIRLCLDRTEIFLTQLRAILRASAFGTVKIMRGLLVYFTRDRKKPTELQLAAAKEELDAFMAERIGR